ncbi:hypothetical protein HID58_050766, partial [Brassica napus]
TDLAEAIVASLLQSISDYIPDFDIFMIAYNRETKTGACRRITNHIDFEYCPTPMEHAIVSVINKNQIFSFRLFVIIFVVIDICIDTLCPMWCITTAIFLEGFPRVQNPNQSVNANFVCQIHEFIEKVPAHGLCLWCEQITEECGFKEGDNVIIE